MNKPTSDESNKEKGINNFKNINNLFSFILSIFISFCPTCPVCLSSYVSMLGLTSIQFTPYTPWVIPVATVLLLVNLFFLHKKFKNTNRIIPFVFSCIGSFLLILRALIGGSKIWIVPGMLLVFLGSILNSLNDRHFNRLTEVFGRNFGTIFSHREPQKATHVAAAQEKKENSEGMRRTVNQRCRKVCFEQD